MTSQIVYVRPEGSIYQLYLYREAALQMVSDSLYILPHVVSFHAISEGWNQKHCDDGLLDQKLLLGVMFVLSL